MEFVISKISLVVLGVVVVTIFADTFGALDEEVRMRSSRDSISQLVEILERIDTSKENLMFTLEMSEMLPAGSSRLEIVNGSLWLVWSNWRCAEGISQDIVFMIEHNGSVELTDKLSCEPGDALIIESNFEGGKSTCQLTLRKYQR
jgi:hypothetical protein